MLRDLLKNREVEERWKPERDVKHECADKLCQHNLQIPHRRGHERLDRAELKLLGEKTHRDQRKNQNERQPEENIIEKRFLNRVARRALIHERNLKVVIHAGDEQEKHDNDVTDRRMKIAADLASEQGVKFSHRLGRHLRLIRVRDFDEHIFEGCASLREFA